MSEMRWVECAAEESNTIGHEGEDILRANTEGNKDRAVDQGLPRKYVYPEWGDFLARVRIVFKWL